MKRGLNTGGLVLLAVATLGILATLVLPAPPAFAHAAYKDSDPPDEGTVSSPPSSVWAEFTERPAEGSYLRIFDPCGRRVDGDDPDILGYRITVSMSADKAGTYVAEWYVISAEDGHPTSGDFVFETTTGSPCPGQGTGGGSAPRKNAGATDGSGAGGGMGSDVPAGTGGGSSAGSDTAAGSRNGGGGDDQGDQDRHGAHGSSKAKGRDGAGPVSDVPLAQPGGPRRDRERGLFEGIPLGGLVAALALAALIGAAGGKVYAGIMGYRR